MLAGFEFSEAKWALARRAWQAPRELQPAVPPVAEEPRAKAGAGPKESGRGAEPGPAAGRAGPEWEWFAEADAVARCPRLPAVAVLARVSHARVLRRRRDSLRRRDQARPLPQPERVHFWPAVQQPKVRARPVLLRVGLPPLPPQ